MKWWFFINYKIFEFYEQSADTNPIVMSVGASSVLVQLNILTLHYFIYTFFGIKLLFHVSIAVVIYALLLLFNYILVYSDKKYIKIFKEMEDWEFSEQRPSTFFFFYFSISILVFLCVIIASLSVS